MDGDFELLDESVATVWAVRLRDGSAAVAKLHAPLVGERFLREVQAVQRHLAAAGFPAPAPVASPASVGNRLLTLETLLDEGATPDGHDPATRKVMAAGLARQVGLCRPLIHRAGLRENPWREGPRGEGPLVVGHTDWRAQNMRVAKGALTAVYDWESLDVLPETELVGGVAAAFTADWTHGLATFPTPQESMGFVAEYARARRRGFSLPERREIARAMERRREYVRSHVDRFLEEQM